MIHATLIKYQNKWHAPQKPPPERDRGKTGTKDKKNKGAKMPNKNAKYAKRNDKNTAKY